MAAQSAALHAKAVGDSSRFDRSFLEKHIRQYILCKFMLSADECTDELLDSLAQQSLAKSMKLPKEIVSDADLGKGCGSAGSLVTKRVLLFMAIERDFRIRLPANEAAKIVTLSDISSLVWRSMEKSSEWAGRLEPG